MEADLSKSIVDALRQALDRAKGLAAAGRAEEAAEVYRRCANLAERYAGYAITDGEKARRLARAESYRNLASELRSRPTGHRPHSEAGPGTGDGARVEELEEEYHAAALSLIEKADVTWADIGGLEQVKREIRMAYGLALAGKPEGMEMRGSRNLLLFGPPGTGKTLLAAATSNELDATFFNVRVSNVLSKYFGESAKLIEALYEVARQRAPSVVFFDEFDALTVRRDAADSGGAERRLLAAILSELDGLSGKRQSNCVFTLAATNLPWMMDAAVLSRFDRRFHVPLPDADVRRRILEIHLGERGYKYEGDLSEVVTRTEGLSGRRLSQACDEAVRAVVEEMNPDFLDHVDKGRLSVEAYKVRMRPLRLRDFTSALETARPDVTQEQIRRFEAWQESNA